MNKSKILLMLSCFILGIGVGIVSYWYFGFKAPADRARAVAKAQQEQMNRMVRSGSLINVTKDEILVRVENSGDPELVGKDILFRVNPDATIQQGSKILFPNPKGEKVDLETYISPGKKVKVMARDIDGEDRTKVESAVVICWEAPETGVK
ncbi:hypothetical protein L9W92_16540 [Pelotomaculum terephthalicicum JT]|uniref:hypothetical protein n=1 Tax=Pelotomaculum terephthalicicum TaxID=206393 RepID=UPI0009D001EF|nr:hypothetical protein [Pelotomaculum terephthalicicum]MCG9969613.1 hypothetical protein [Pelotomaculum terephthalicicum JT]OPX83365.1 MAG: hypothetical protein A4E53_04669 [Pelotomaculum sp. PtaB.Bin104]